MKLSEIYKIANELAPKTFSDAYCAAYNAYDNSGVLVDTGEDIHGVLFTLDLTFAAIDKAIALGANLIITHHPAMYGKINHARIDADDLTERKMLKCIRNGISVISMHLNLDCAPNGIDESLASGICDSAMAINPQEGVLTRCLSIMDKVEDAGYGRAYNVQETTLSALVAQMKTTFETNRILVYGDGDKSIHRVASFCGAGADDKAVVFAKKEGVQAIVSSDFKHHVLTAAVESGLAVIVLTHYASENYGFKKYYKKIRQQMEIPCEYHTDENLL